jgi:hypothetical protein
LTTPAAIAAAFRERGDCARDEVGLRTIATSTSSRHRSSRFDIEQTPPSTNRRPPIATGW